MFEDIKKSLGLDSNERQLKGIRPLVKKIKEEQEKIQKEHGNDTLEDFIQFAQQKTAEYKKNVQEKIKKVKEDNKDVLGEDHVDQIQEFNKKVQIERQKILDEILPEAYALVRETSKKVLKAPDGKPMEHFEVQLMGGVALHWGRVTEMVTGEGKTLVATLPAYLNALTGEGVHIVTVNEYLAQRDARWMAPLYDALGLQVGINLSETGYELFGFSLDSEIIKLIEERKKLEESMKIEPKEEIQKSIDILNTQIGEKGGITENKESLLNTLKNKIDVDILEKKIKEQTGGREFNQINPDNQKSILKDILKEIIKKEAYNADITYGINSEFGFDYLRDNMRLNLEEKVQRGHHFAIIDEVDSILVDEAGTPLIISGRAELPIDQYTTLNPKIKSIIEKQKGIIEEKAQQFEELFARYENYLEENRMQKGESVKILNELGYLLLQIKKGDPKHKLIVENLKVAPLLQKLLRDKEYEDSSNTPKTTLEDEELFFVVSEKDHAVVFTEKGWDEVHGKDFKLPHFAILSKELEDVEKSELSSEEKEKKKQALEAEHLKGLDILNAADKLLKAYVFFERDVKYVVEDGKVFIINEFTGRKEPGKRYSDGLHEAIEAKEGVEINPASQTHATITYQNYFRMYSKLSGMTGTAETEKEEFLKIYGMDTLVIPTNKPLNREEHEDVVYLTERAKFKAVLEDIVENHKKGRPILIGTVSIEKSNLLSRMLSKLEVPHRVLNASRTLDKTKEWQGALSTESEIVKHAGEKGSVTISTNMAGRGTDIILGYNPELLIQKMSEIAKTMPNKEKDYVVKLLKDEKFLGKYPGLKDSLCLEKISDYKKALEDIAYHIANKEREEVVKLGGLHVIGTERHDSRRIDNQLRGRAGRQGDPGSSKFYLSLEDDLMRKFGSERLQKICARLGLEEDEVIEHKFLTKAIANAQKKVEGHHFEGRKYLLHLDDTDDKLRKWVYRDRDILLAEKDPENFILPIARDIVEKIITTYTDKEKLSEDWEWNGLEEKLYQVFGIPKESLQIDKESVTVTDLQDKLESMIVQKYTTRSIQIVNVLESMEMTHSKETYKKALDALKKDDLTEEERKAKIEQFNADYQKKISKIKKEYEDPRMIESIDSQLKDKDKMLALYILDEKWKSFLSQVDLMKEGIGLAGWGQKNPVIEYRKRSFTMFDDFTDDVREEIAKIVFRDKAIRFTKYVRSEDEPQKPYSDS